MSHLHRTFRRSTLPLLLVVCLAALSFSYAFADEAHRPLAATDLLGSPDAAVNGKFAVGSAAVGTKALTVTGVIDFLGAGTVHNYFTQGGGNNMQINTNVDEANAVGDASRSQWKLVLGSSLDWFSIRRSPPGGSYNEDALFFIQGSTGNVGIATVDTGNGGAIPFTPQARLHVQAGSGDAVLGVTSATTGNTVGVLGQSDSTSGTGVEGRSLATSGTTRGVAGEVDSTSGTGVSGAAHATTGTTYGVAGVSDSAGGYGVYGANTAGGYGLGTPDDAVVGGSLTLGSAGLTAVGGTELDLRILRGGVNANGTCNPTGLGFTCSRSGTGTYTITFNTAFASGQSVTPVVTASLSGSWDPHTVAITSVSNTAFSFQTYNAKANLADVNVFFIVVGRR